MKAISLWQPYATLIAIGLKPFETRHWTLPKTLIGQRIAIHAAKRPFKLSTAPKEVREALVALGDEYWLTSLPYGAVVCTARLAGAHQLGQESEICGFYTILRSVEGSAPLTSVEDDAFGDYGYGRWVWHLTDIERVIPPVPAIGRQGLFSWPTPGTEP